LACAKFLSAKHKKVEQLGNRSGGIGPSTESNYGHRDGTPFCNTLQKGNPCRQKFFCMYLTALLKIVIPSPSCLFFRRDQCGCWVGRTCLSGCGISPRTLPVVSVKPDRLKTSKRHCLTILIPSFLFCSLSLQHVCFLPPPAAFRFVFYSGF